MTGDRVDEIMREHIYVLIPHREGMTNGLVQSYERKEYTKV